jgi:hypothetical protein
MARFRAEIATPLSPDEAFARMAAFERVPEWDPATSASTRIGEPGVGAEYDVATRFAGRTLSVRYRTTAHEPPRRFVVEASLPNGVVLRDEITVAPGGEGSVVTYDARIVPSGIWRLADPIFQLVFARTGARAVPLIRKYLSG